MQAACKEVPLELAPYTPGLAFIVVSKRINTRFFGMGHGPPSNPRCGTVVDNTVTLSERYDFFLVSQKVTQGTVSPTSFNIVEDSSAISPDIQQRLAYALTHLYYNWPVILIFVLLSEYLLIVFLYPLGYSARACPNPVRPQIGLPCGRVHHANSARTPLLASVLPLRLEKTNE